MSNFEITYAFVALDRFSETAAKIQKEVRRIQESLGRVTATTEVASTAMMGLGAVGMRSTAAIGGIHRASGVAMTGLAKVKSGISSVALETGGFAGKVEVLRERMAKFGDERAMGSFYKFLNISLPLMLVAKAGFDYADALENANHQLSIQFSKNKAQLSLQKQLNAEALKYQETTRISAAQYMAAAATVASMTNNIGIAAKAMPTVAEYAIFTNQTQTMAAAAHSLIQGIVSGKIPGLNIRLTGATTIERFNQALEILHKKLGGILPKDSETASAKTRMLINNFATISASLMTSLTPAFLILATGMAKVSAVLSPLIKKHKDLTAAFGLLIIGSLMLVAAEMVLGAGATVVATAMSAAMKVVELFTLVIDGLKFAMFGLDYAEMVNPIGLVIAAIALAIGVVIALGMAMDNWYKKYPNFKRFIGGIIDGFKGIVKWIKEAIDEFKKFDKIFTYVLPKETNIQPSASFTSLFNIGKGKAFQHHLNVNVNVRDPKRQIDNVHVTGKGNAITKLTSYVLGQNMHMSSGVV